MGLMAGFYEKFINCLVIVSLMLALLVAVDYATNDTITHINDTTEIPEHVIIVNESMTSDSIVTHDGKIHVDKNVKTKRKTPTVTITSKPSCGCRYSYTWHKKTFVNYCPHCHRYGTLRNVHKWPARFEQELTCDPRLGGCGADYCGCCGKEKYSWSHYYLKGA